MKAKHEMDPAAALPHAAHRPGEVDLAAALGTAAAPIAAFLAEVRSFQPGVTAE